MEANVQHGLVYEIGRRAVILQIDGAGFLGLHGCLACLKAFA
jgi:hypothetical protein